MREASGALHIHSGSSRPIIHMSFPATGTALLSLALHPEEHGKRAETQVLEESWGWMMQLLNSEPSSIIFLFLIVCFLQSNFLTAFT